MKERIPIQKEFGEIERIGNKIIVKKFGSEEEAGGARIFTTKWPVAHMIVDELKVLDKEDYGKGFASQLMNEIENISREREVAIVLADAISEARSPNAYGMYAKRKGWIEVKSIDGTRHYIFGGANDDEVQKLVRYYT